MFGRLRTDVPDQCVSGSSTYTAENTPIQLQEISNITMSAVPRMCVTGANLTLVYSGGGGGGGGGGGCI